MINTVQNLCRRGCWFILQLANARHRKPGRGPDANRKALIDGTRVLTIRHLARPKESRQREENVGSAPITCYWSDAITMQASNLVYLKPGFLEEPRPVTWDLARAHFRHEDLWQGQSSQR